MCGICGIVVAPRGGGRRGEARSDERDAAAPRSRQRRREAARAGGACRAPPVDHRPGRRRPADRQRGRHACGSSRTARSTTTPSSGELLGARAHASRPHCDTEVLVHLYEEHGPRYVERLRGMFAFALWDARGAGSCSPATGSASSRSTTAVADGELSFASELKALLAHPGFSRELDLDALEAYLEFGCVPAPLTIFRERAQAARRATFCVWRRGRGERRRSSATRGRRRSRAVDVRDARTRGARRGAPRAPARLRPRAPASPTSRSGSCSPAASTRQRSPPSPRAQSVEPRAARSRSASRSAPSTSSTRRAPGGRALRRPSHHELVMRAERRRPAPARSSRPSTSRSPTTSALPTYLVVASWRAAT